MSEFQKLVEAEVKRIGELNDSRLELGAVGLMLRDMAETPFGSKSNARAALVNAAARLQRIAEDNDLCIPEK